MIYLEVASKHVFIEEMWMVFNVVYLILNTAFGSKLRHKKQIFRFKIQ